MSLWAGKFRKVKNGCKKRKTCNRICKVLQNNKALVGTTVEDVMYYEITYNGDKDELYLDAYKKQENVLIKPGEFEHATAK